MDASPYVIFSYSIRSPSTKETYFRRLKRFFDAVPINGSTFEDRCNLFTTFRNYPLRSVESSRRLLLHQEPESNPEPFSSLREECETYRNYMRECKH